MAKKLSDILKELTPLHRRSVVPTQRNIDFPTQRSFEGIPSYANPTVKAITLGRFYEYINRALYGGTLNDIKYDLSVENGDVGGECVKPDVVDEKNR